MTIQERHIKVIGEGVMEHHLDLVKRFEAVEARLGYPAARWYNVLSGPSPVDTRVLEREWPSVAAMEACIEHAGTDSEWRALVAEAQGLDIKTQIETLQLDER